MDAGFWCPEGVAGLKKSIGICTEYREGSQSPAWTYTRESDRLVPDPQPVCLIVPRRKS